ncbi:protein CHROMATIN REMODELING 25 isoform X1 [Cucumis melo var. makuwa]|uniref:Protein CHROMATIN REMODELING 25 isoform X1 n=1 Tax=Cucumis melo var. makuwa TaxID=1194695 RepID=A0A5D3CU99_CUCMM|nr:protein CHROMATIN REMODELING 25 isoform X1 [Cucumis melo var. makuwa]
MADEDEIVPASDISDSSDDYIDINGEAFEDEDDEEEQSSSPSPSSDEDLKSKNVDALLRGNLVVRRQSLLPRVLSVAEGAAVCRKPFKPPCSSGYDERNNQLARRLWARKRFVPWGSLKPASSVISTNLFLPKAAEKDVEEESVTLPPGIDPLVLWQPEDSELNVTNLASITVDPLLVRFLRPHQREGVQFMFECVSGLHKATDIFGCILADDMGLGKTLQSISLLYTLLCQGFDGKPMVKKAIIVTPTSLVSNWEAEIKKWVGERVQLIALCESSREDVVSSIDNFVHPKSSLQVLIISYETFRMHSSKFGQSESCDLLICDEAHRLKNDQTLTNRALAALSCRRRVLLSGTPMQNDLEEFFAMVNFTNPGILGDVSHFRRYYEHLGEPHPKSQLLEWERAKPLKYHIGRPILTGVGQRHPITTLVPNNTPYPWKADISWLLWQYFTQPHSAPIICGREPIATEEEKKLGAQRSAELSEKVNQFILRRTNALLSNHLPPKIVEVICCKLSPLQADLYNHFVQSKNVKRAITEELKQAKILAYITALKKLCNHPKLIYDTIKSGSPGTSGLESCIRFFPPEMSGAWTGGDGAWVELSGKMHVLARLLAHLRQRTDDRIVLVSNYTQTLDLFAQLCRERRYPYLRLDGSTSISKRQKLVNRFNDLSKDEFVFLLSSKAGGCGLNLIGGNRLVLFDPDWNPANDKQAAARVWRDGQKKRVFIYRFLSTGTIEEKVYQRQMSKEGLQKVIQQESTNNLTTQVNFLSSEDLRDLFSFHDNVRPEDMDEDLSTNGACQSDQVTSDIGGFAQLAGCLDKLKKSEQQVGSPLEEDLANWGHHFDSTTVPDTILQASAGDEVTFIFSNQVDGKLVPVESMTSPRVKEAEGNGNNSGLNQNTRQKPFLLSQHRKPLQSVTSNEDPNKGTLKFTSNVFQRETMKPVRTSVEGSMHVTLKHKHSLGNYLPQKRMSDVSECVDFE